MSQSFEEKGELEQIRSYFVGPGDEEQLRRQAGEAVERALEWVKNPRREPIYGQEPLDSLRAAFSDPTVPEGVRSVESVLEEVWDRISRNNIRVNDPRYIGHMTAAVPWFTVVLDILTTAMNQNQVKLETALASTCVERQSLAWLHRLFYDRDETYYRELLQSDRIFPGNVTSGGTVGNLTALTVARERALPGARVKGLIKTLREYDYTDVVVLASRRVHYSVKKSLALLGHGEDSLVTIPVDRNNKILIDELNETIRRLRSENILVMAMVGIAGNTETGNIDDLETMARIAEENSIWFHVDAAWGGALAASPRNRSLLKGIEKSDSVVVDGHKLFYLPLALGAVLFRDTDTPELLRHNANYILRKGSSDLGQTTLEGSRRFNSWKLWFALQTLGTRGYDILLSRSLELAERFAALIDESPSFERTSTPEICILTYRYVPAPWAEERDGLRKADDRSGMDQLNQRLDRLNREIQERQKLAGNSFVSYTRLESAGYDRQILVLRAVLANILTEEIMLREILEEQERLGQQIMKEGTI